MLIQMEENFRLDKTVVIKQWARWFPSNPRMPHPLPRCYAGIVAGRPYLGRQRNSQHGELCDLGTIAEQVVVIYKDEGEEGSLAFGLSDEDRDGQYEVSASPDPAAVTGLGVDVSLELAELLGQSLLIG